MRRDFFRITFLALLLSAGSIPYAVAVEPARPEHYSHVTFVNADAAVAGLNEKIAEIATVLENKPELEFTDLESIHEKTYTLESAVDKIRAQKTEIGAISEATINAIDEAVQALHYASENQDQIKTREWFSKLQTASAALASNNITPASGDAQANIKPDDTIYKITIKDHIFSPAELKIPANQKIELIVENLDATPEEFESDTLRREKIIAGNSKATILIGPLKSGVYEYYGEFNMDTAKGRIIAE